MDRYKLADDVSHRLLKWHLHDLRMAMEIGCCRNMRVIIKLRGGLLETANDPRLRAEYAWLLRKAERMFEIEAIHGAGSLLELDHPMVLSLQTAPRPAFSLAELEAARKFRGSHMLRAAAESCTASSTKGIRDLKTV